MCVYHKQLRLTTAITGHNYVEIGKGDTHVPGVEREKGVSHVPSVERGKGLLMCPV